MNTIWLSLFFTIHFLTSLLLFLYAINVLVLSIKSGKHRKNSTCTGDPFTEPPIITIQLPLFNEQYVAKRIIEATAKIEWPKDKLHIQVCDDSTDNTLDITKDTIATLTNQGYWIELYHRTKRTGQKGGALREAMETALGEYIAIFDADFIPDPAFLKKVMPCFNGQPKLGMVQTRWGHLNENFSPLTKAQAIAIDTHFMIEQVCRNGEQWFYNFNGTGGVWRKECIIDAGNWQDDTITEDLDLSYRAQMKGWKFHYCHDVVNPAELPVQLTAYKSQQFRWAKGSIQTAKKTILNVLKTKEPFIKKCEAMLHLTYYMVHPLLVLNAVAFLPTLIFLKSAIGLDTFTHLGFLFTILLLLIAPATTLYAQTLITTEWRNRISWLPWLIFYGTGIAVSNTKAVLEALIGKPSEFIRTPKLGKLALSEKWKTSNYKMPLSSDMVFELLLILYMIGVSIWAITIEMWYILPFMIYYILSFGIVLFTQLQQNGTIKWFLPRQSIEPTPEPAE